MMRLRTAWTIENYTSEVNPTKSPTSEDFGSGIDSGSGEPPKQTEPTQFPKQNEQLA